MVKFLQINLLVMALLLLDGGDHAYGEMIDFFVEPKSLTNWTAMVMRSRIEPMKEVARMIRGHEDLILNWFDMVGKVSNGIAEGLNGKAKVTFRKSMALDHIK